MRRPIILALASAGLAACSPSEEAARSDDAEPDAAVAEASQDNPFFAEWDTPFGVPPFERIRPEHFKPAFDEGMARHKAEIEAIKTFAEPADFENTVEALERSGEFLSRVSSVFWNRNSLLSDDEIRAIASEMSPRLSRHRDEIALDPELFARIKAVYDQREALGLDPEQRRLLDETWKRFERAGANLDDEAKARLTDLNASISERSTAFGQNLLKETNSFELVIDDEADLAGLPGFVVAAGAAAAKSKGHDGKWVYTLHRSSITPFLQFADNRELREKIYRAYVSRASQGNKADNRDTLREIAVLRAERANTLGYASHAEWVLEDRMAGTPDRVDRFLRDLWKPGLQRAAEEAEILQAAIREDGGDFDLMPWDWWYYAEKVRRSRYDLDAEAVKPYFQLENVRDGAFEVANRLFGIQFIERADIPTWHEDVTAFEVQEADGTHIGVLYLDYFPRESKRGGAWMNTFRRQSTLDGRVTPVALNACNFPRPAGDVPSLLAFSEAETLFHEFGHGLHGLLSDVRYESLSGTNVQWDYVEFPAQILEHWAADPSMMKRYARHYETDEPIPDELIEKLKAAGKFNQGFATTEYLAASLLDMAWHSLEQGDDPGEALAFEEKTLDGLGLIPEIGPRYRSPYFAHVFSGGYSAGYYSYIWAEVLDADGFDAFKESGDIFDPELARRLREHVYAAGNTADPMDLYVRFRGREPTVDALLRNRGLGSASAP